MAYKTALAKVLSHGSAKDGTHHWWHMRLTSVFLIPLMLWFVYSLVMLAGADVDAMRGWFASPWNAAACALAFGLSYYHAMLGLQTVFEDYISCSCSKVAILVIMKGACLVLGVLSILATAKLHFLVTG